ncbi:MAG: cysteine--tRNA ligase [Ignavibacteria bacterium GWB2_35_12]|nr:MAG: cysteine--tRNA ligase [Ignavibacteria bacterium GWA2_35_8]OGU41734.1 MAG: cysteine--tRNA ligase [Ignavibacteria bacterium GWB2_35_12]OGU90582.1 MAG: cysteine--tRNA ligase [Ignavibacteria bacterium RIFOXYA2_FULL_35_10]OGV23337.1 MAG: cysteine--tRNA ligase [Ignavibacteria bacterium RIFOXYC2_FULL_35_21]
MQIYLYNSLTKTIEPFKPLEGNTVRMYSCGPTVYNFAHIGNMRAFLFADLLQRVLRTIGAYNVKWVMNITNIDDKTIRDSAPGSTAWLPEMGSQTDNLMDNLLKFTQYFEKSFLEDISKLGIRLEHFFSMPKATEFIPQMQELIRRIIKNGIAYISEGSVYFNVSEWRKKDTYGKLYKIDFENFRAGARIDADQYEREDANDFALWKYKKPDEPFWEFEVDGIICDGRPGWHIECSTMEKELLGLPFDIHTGGVDLKFPHHEDEIAQSKAGYGVEPNAFWCHNEFLEVEGQKMSKSLGNYFTLRDLLEKGIDPLDIRIAMLSAHYGSTYNFTFDGINSARKARFRIQDYIYDLHQTTNGSFINTDVLNEMKSEVFTSLATDLHTPKALASVFTFINDNPANTLNEEARKSALEFFTKLNNIFDVWKIEPRPVEVVNIPIEITDLAEQRLKAKMSKNFAEADELRQKIIDAGYYIQDSENGYRLGKKW